MAQHNDTGKMGEEIAQQYLTEHGYALMECNWRRGKYEVDIVAYKDGVIIFVEVKTRSSVDYGNPEAFVDKRKQRAYVQLANTYVLEKRRDEEVRFDIIAVTLTTHGPNVEHFENAFNAISAKFK
ncbi:MAG: YraN family protein [Bacteroidales bacterium]|nr:YraN family protein [Bacteroidales bacterium]